MSMVVVMSLVVVRRGDADDYADGGDSGCNDAGDDGW